MTASNHFITGALIGASVANPWLAVPVAVASHFVLDALPQYGYDGPNEINRTSFRLFRKVLALDITLVLITIWALTFIINRPELILFGIAGYSPDFVWVYKFSITEKFGKQFLENKSWFTKFHADIQRLESPWFIIWEVVYFAGIFTSLIWVAA